MKSIGVIIIGIILFLGVVWCIGWFGLGWQAYFSPREQNIQRHVFENTKSYVHGKVQDLAKYYEEYQKADSSEDRDAIKNIINMNFADFNSDNIANNHLRNFLIQMRGY